MNRQERRYVQKLMKKQKCAVTICFRDPPVKYESKKEEIPLNKLIELEVK